MTELTRDEKITGIMTMIGIGERDFDKHRPNYSALADAEIDAKYERLLQDEESLVQWRESRGATPTKDSTQSR